MLELLSCYNVCGYYGDSRTSSSAESHVTVNELELVAKRLRQVVVMKEVRKARQVHNVSAVINLQ